MNPNEITDEIISSQNQEESDNSMGCTSCRHKVAQTTFDMLTGTYLPENPMISIATPQYPAVEQSNIAYESKNVIDLLYGKENNIISNNSYKSFLHNNFIISKEFPKKEFPKKVPNKNPFAPMFIDKWFCFFHNNKIIYTYKNKDTNDEKKKCIIDLNDEKIKRQCFLTIDIFYKYESFDKTYIKSSYHLENYLDKIKFDIWSNFHYTLPLKIPKYYDCLLAVRFNGPCGYCCKISNNCNDTTAPGLAKTKPIISFTKTIKWDNSFLNGKYAGATTVNIGDPTRKDEYYIECDLCNPPI